MYYGIILVEIDYNKFDCIEESECSFISRNYVCDAIYFVIQSKKTMHFCAQNAESRPHDIIYEALKEFCMSHSFILQHSQTLFRLRVVGESLISYGMRGVIHS